MKKARDIGFFGLIGFMMFLTLWERLEDRKPPSCDEIRTFGAISVTVNEEEVKRSPFGTFIPISDSLMVGTIVEYNPEDSTFQITSAIQPISNR